MSKDLKLFKEVVQRIAKNKELYNTLDNYPMTYSTLIVEDDYVNDSLMLNDFLLERLFPDHYDCLCWFLWDWIPGASVLLDGKEFVINNVDDYLKFKEDTWNEG